MHELGPTIPSPSLHIKTIAGCLTAQSFSLDDDALLKKKKIVTEESRDWKELMVLLLWRKRIDVLASHVFTKATNMISSTLIFFLRIVYALEAGCQVVLYDI